MNLEQRIQTRGFASVWHRLRVNLFVTHGWLQEGMKAFLKPYGLTKQQFNILRILRGQHPHAISTRAIRTRMLDRMPDVSRLVDRLVKKGLADKRLCADDRRCVDVTITADGLALLKKIDAANPGLDHLVAETLTEAEATQLNTLLDKLRGDQ